MKSLLLAVASITLLAACAQQPQHVWKHLDGLGDQELQRDQRICRYFADNNIPPHDFNNHPYLEEKLYGGYPFYGHQELVKRHAAYFYWHREFYRQGFNTFASTDDMALACMHGNGWYRVDTDPASNAATEEARQIAMKLRELTGL